jgi:hypothetical protein
MNSVHQGHARLLATLQLLSPDGPDASSIPDFSRLPRLAVPSSVFQFLKVVLRFVYAFFSF